MEGRREKKREALIQERERERENGSERAWT